MEKPKISYETIRKNQTLGDCLASHNRKEFEKSLKEDSE